MTSDEKGGGRTQSFAVAVARLIVNQDNERTVQKGSNSGSDGLLTVQKMHLSRTMTWASVACNVSSRRDFCRARRCAPFVAYSAPPY